MAYDTALPDRAFRLPGDGLAAVVPRLSDALPGPLPGLAIYPEMPNLLPSCNHPLHSSQRSK